MQFQGFVYRILLVDDEPALRDLGKALLSTQGYEIVCAADGLEGLAALKGSLPDIIISDLRMPNMDGFEFLAVVRQRFPHIPVIVISGEFTGTSVPSSVLADAFFSKGAFSPADMFAKIAVLVRELPTRARRSRQKEAAVWLKNTDGTVSVTCAECLRTFPVSAATEGANEANCPFCSSSAGFRVEAQVRANSNGSSLKPSRDPGQGSAVKSA